MTNDIEDDNIETYPFKILFSVRNYVTNTFIFYLGGDRLQPLKIVEYDTNIIDIREAYITNTGKNKTDWIISIKYRNNQDQITVIQSFGKNGHTYLFSSPLYTGDGTTRTQVNYLEYKGSGCWISNGLNYSQSLAETLIDTYTLTRVETHKVGIGTNPAFMGESSFNEYYLYEILPKCSQDYFYNGQRLFAPEKTFRTRNYSGLTGSFLLYQGELKTSFGTYVYDEKDDFSSSCNSHLKPVGQSSTESKDNLDFYLSDTLKDTYYNQVNITRSYSGLENYGYSVDSVILENKVNSFIVGTGGKDCINFKSSFYEKFTNLGVEGAISKNEHETFVCKSLLNNNLEINTSACFSIDSPIKLDINEDTTKIVIDPGYVFFTALQGIFTDSILIASSPLVPSETQTEMLRSANQEYYVHEPANFNVVSQKVIVSQIANSEQSEFWLATGTVSSVEVVGSSDYNSNIANSQQISKMTILVSKVEKVKCSYFATENGNILCSNNSILGLVYKNYNKVIHPSDAYSNYIEYFYDSEDYLPITNFVKNIFYFSRKCSELFSKNGDNYVEVWKIQANGDFVRDKVKKGKVLSLKAPSDYQTNTDVQYKIEAISYYP